ncbi:MAG: hypothetical protein ACRDNF_13665 [Streptosporangiaceae bacterium]
MPKSPGMLAARWLPALAVTSVSALMLTVPAASPVLAAMRGGPAPASTGCSAGAHSLGPGGGHLYPETGNGGYRTGCR